MKKINKSINCFMETQKYMNVQTEHNINSYRLNIKIYMKAINGLLKQNGKNKYSDFLHHNRNIES